MGELLLPPGLWSTLMGWITVVLVLYSIVMGVRQYIQEGPTKWTPSQEVLSYMSMATELAHLMG